VRLLSRAHLPQAHTAAVRLVFTLGFIEGIFLSQGYVFVKTLIFYAVNLILGASHMQKYISSSICSFRAKSTWKTNPATGAWVSVLPR
jgi:hypothetical protein